MPYIIPTEFTDNYPDWLADKLTDDESGQTYDPAPILAAEILERSFVNYYVGGRYDTVKLEANPPALIKYIMLVLVAWKLFNRGADDKRLDAQKTEVVTMLQEIRDKKADIPDAEAMLKTSTAWTIPKRPKVPETSLTEPVENADRIESSETYDKKNDDYA